MPLKLTECDQNNDGEAKRRLPFVGLFQELRLSWFFALRYPDIVQTADVEHGNQFLPVVDEDDGVLTLQAVCRDVHETALDVGNAFFHARSVLSKRQFVF